MSYRNSLQTDALKLVVKKPQGSLAVEGKLPEDELAAHSDDDDDLIMALAHKIVSGEQEEVDTGFFRLFPFSLGRLASPTEPSIPCKVLL